MERKFIQFTSSFLILALLIFIVPIISSCESYFPLNEHIDTKFAKDFRVENFESIKIGMRKSDVEKALGKPLLFEQKAISSLQPKNSYISVYAQDGKSNWGDFAWESFDVYFNTENIVIGKSRKWWYD